MNWRLVADVGGTNVRFARATGRSELDGLAEFPISDFSGFEHALTAYLRREGGAGSCQSAAIAAAGPVSTGSINLTNNDWCISKSTISALLGGKPVRLFNDLQAAALSIPMLAAADLLPVFTPPGAPDPLGTRLAVNVGTGFGASPLLHADGSWYATATEAGHVRLGAVTAEQYELIADRSRGFCTIEDALSGRGLQNLYAFYAEASRPPPAQAIFAATETNAAAASAVAMFTGLLARACGDLVLAHGAWGGVYLFGSVALEWSRQDLPTSFVRDFAGQGQMSQRIARVPVHAVLRDNAPLLGLAAYRMPSDHQT